MADLLSMLASGAGAAVANGGGAGGGSLTGNSDINAYLNFQQDPSYLAFQRALDLELNTQRQQTADAINRIKTRLATQIPQVQRQGEIARENISGGMEGRGLYRSGEHEYNLLKQRQNEEQRVAAMRTSEASSEADLNARLAGYIGQAGTHQAEQVMGLAQQEAAFKAQLAQQQQATADERSYQNQVRSEENARTAQYRQEDIARQQASEDTAYQRQQSLYNQQQAAEDARQKQYMQQQAGQQAAYVPQYSKGQNATQDPNQQPNPQGLRAL